MMSREQGILTRRLKAGIMEPEERAVQGNGSINTSPLQRIHMQNRGTVRNDVFYAVRAEVI
jgi:hypothetical protein